ncbi:hypothetical protein ADJ80_01865 [Aggregatibacter aphrophilus]|jgi:hypothetical protein|uniref:Uncharacterized protein n=1 Tax=Aggregatibacter aphrophilus TaxID=732 RepID=A0ABX9VU62_AGGAP|nr:hypothetical protein [Aggregatibacter aphrophilus]AKU62592.1 hypothetical protein ADJ80_01865 [Aggregatibacter aphrophilus]RMW80735.1 hypothetical protein DOL88_09585 [Aggregatibacter aphrophilus]
MDPIVLDILDDVLDKYLSYSEEELEERLDISSLSPFWIDICSVIKFTELFNFSLKDSFVMSKSLNHVVFDDYNFRKLEILNHFYDLCASNDDFFEYFEVAA